MLVSVVILGDDYKNVNFYTMEVYMYLKLITTSVLMVFAAGCATTETKPEQTEAPVTQMEQIKSSEKVLRLRLSSDTNVK